MATSSLSLNVRLTRKWQFPGQFWLTWLLVAVAVSRAVMGHRTKGFFWLFAAFVLAPVHAGVTFNFGKRRYRFYSSLGGIRYGFWRAIPPTERVVLKNDSSLYTSHGDFGQWQSTTTQNQCYLLLLSVQDSQEGIVIRQYQPAAREEALRVANLLAEELQVGFVNHAAVIH